MYNIDSGALNYSSHNTKSKRKKDYVYLEFLISFNAIIENQIM